MDADAGAVSHVVWMLMQVPCLCYICAVAGAVPMLYMCCCRSCILCYICAGAGAVLFLEEDHYVAEDFLHVLHMMQTRNQQLTYPVFLSSDNTKDYKKYVVSYLHSIIFTQKLHILTLKGTRGADLVCKSFERPFLCDALLS